MPSRDYQISREPSLGQMWSFHKDIWQRQNLHHRKTDADANSIQPHPNHGSQSRKGLFDRISAKETDDRQGKASFARFRHSDTRNVDYMSCWCQGIGILPTRWLVDIYIQTTCRRGKSAICWPRYWPPVTPLPFPFQAKIVFKFDVKSEGSF